MVTKARQEKIDRMHANRLPGVRVVLEDVHDPHNAAAILRSCDGLGVGSVWYLFDQEEPYDPLAVGRFSSATANRWVDIETFINRTDVEQRLHTEGYSSIATTIHDPAAEELWQTDVSTGNVAVWVGNEQRGLTPDALQFCDRKLTIPMRGMVESFNVSVTAALVLAEIGRQRRSLGES